jgi:hypothetical protein
MCRHTQASWRTCKANSNTAIHVLISLYVSSYYYIVLLYVSSYCCTCVLMLLNVYMCPHTTTSYYCICVLILLYMYPRTIIYVFSYCCRCVLMLLNVSSHSQAPWSTFWTKQTCLQPTNSYRSLTTQVSVCVCVGVGVCVCVCVYDHTAPWQNAYYRICVFMLLYCTYVLILWRMSAQRLIFVIRWEQMRCSDESRWDVIRWEQMRCYKMRAEWVWGGTRSWFFWMIFPADFFIIHESRCWVWGGTRSGSTAGKSK